MGLLRGMCLHFSLVTLLIVGFNVPQSADIVALGNGLGQLKSCVKAAPYPERFRSALRPPMRSPWGQVLSSRPRPLKGTAKMRGAPKAPGFDYDRILYSCFVDNLRHNALRFSNQPSSHTIINHSSRKFNPDKPRSAIFRR